DPNLSTPKPDIYYSAKLAQINRRVRRDLANYIVLSSRSSLPAAPNFFLEGKSASGRPDVTQNQAMYNGAIGARGMLQLQNYGQPTLIYDGNAYTVTSTYHPGTGTLQMYATHPRPSVAPAGEPQYYMTQLGAYAMTHAPDTFRNGALAYRNARDWTQQERDRLIASANAAAQRMSTDTRSFSRTSENIGSSTMARESSESDTSADELAINLDAATKRQKRPTTQH
ncbi:uncharacterized protein MYCGRDRAFT_51600, partial [Zymoseptoria tritici IPO323]